MTTAAWSTYLERLDPAVAGWSTPQFVLRDNLERLGRVHGVDAPEATIFYAARILEALAAAALGTVGLEPSSNVFSNLDALQQFNLIPTSTRYWAHALRRF